MASTSRSDRSDDNSSVLFNNIAEFFLNMTLRPEDQKYSTDYGGWIARFSSLVAENKKSNPDLKMVF